MRNKTKNEKKSNLMIFEEQEVEVFELDGQVLFNPYHVGRCLELGNSAVKMAVSKMNKKQVVKVTNSKVKDIDFRKLHNTGENFITESGVYKLVFRSNKPNAETFTDWVTDEVLPTIRKTGGYVNSVDLMVNTYFSDVPDEQKSLVKGLLVNIEEKQKKIVSLNNENDLLAQKNLEWADRPLINSLVRAYASSIGDFGKAWNNYKKELLYKHSININSRITNHINTTGKKPKTLDMIDDSELSNAISVAVSLCRENNVSIDDLLNNKAN
ncbi:MAG: transporter [Lachnospiraceae bacterium]|nr:transporter [Lachnospiraceae bacterium]